MRRRRPPAPVDRPYEDRPCEDCLAGLISSRSFIFTLRHGRRRPSCELSRFRHGPRTLQREHAMAMENQGRHANAMDRPEPDAQDRPFQGDIEGAGNQYYRPISEQKRENASPPVVFYSSRLDQLLQHGNKPRSKCEDPHQ